MNQDISVTGWQTGCGLHAVVPGTKVRKPEGVSDHSAPFAARTQMSGVLPPRRFMTYTTMARTGGTTVAFVIALQGHILTA